MKGRYDCSLAWSVDMVPPYCCTVFILQKNTSCFTETNEICGLCAWKLLWSKFFEIQLTFNNSTNHPHWSTIFPVLLGYCVMETFEFIGIKIGKLSLGTWYIVACNSEYLGSDLKQVKWLNKDVTWSTIGSLMSFVAAQLCRKGWKVNDFLNFNIYFSNTLETIPSCPLGSSFLMYISHFVHHIGGSSRSQCQI